MTTAIAIHRAEVGRIEPSADSAMMRLQDRRCMSRKATVSPE
jgi:hypothetical protein